MTLKQLWSIVRGRQTGFRWANMSWTFYPDGDPMNKREPHMSDIAERLHQMMLRPGFQSREDQETLLDGRAAILALRVLLGEALSSRAPDYVEVEFPGWSERVKRILVQAERK